MHAKLARAAAIIPVVGALLVGHGRIALGATAGRAVLPQLAAVTHLRVSATEVTTLVDIPSRVTVGHGDLCGNPSEATIGGTAKLTLVSLLRMPYTTYDEVHYDGVSVIGRYVDSDGQSHLFDTLCDASRTLLPGVYRLVVQHTPGTASVTLRLGGLTGEATLDRWQSSRARLRLLPTITPSVASPVTAEYAATDTLAGRGVIQDFAFINVGAISPLGSATDCVIGPGHPALPQPVAVSPACPTGSAGTATYDGTVGGEFYFASGNDNIPAGRYQVGVSYQTVGDAHPGGVFATWIPFAG